VDALTQIVLTMSVATSGLRFGIHTSTFLVQSKIIPVQPVETPQLESDKQHHSNRRALYHIVMICVGFSVWLAVALLAGLYPPWRKTCLALVLAPIGCYIRYLLAITLNPVTPHFPVGTFSANMIATAFLAMLQVVMQHGATRHDSIGCDVAQAFVDGYCGCLSTISTFATEIRGMRRRNAYRYAMISIVGGQALVVTIFGTYLWVRLVALSVGNALNYVPGTRKRWALRVCQLTSGCRALCRDCRQCMDLYMMCIEQ
jgi:CrcB protein